MRNSNYSIKGWWRALRKNGLAKSRIKVPTPKQSWKSPFFLGIAFICLGLLKIVTFKDSLLEWWRITNMSYEEVAQTPYLPIWTSGRGVVGILFFVGGTSWIARGLALKKTLAEQGSAHQSTTRLESKSK